MLPATHLRGHSLLSASRSQAHISLNKIKIVRKSHVHKVNSSVIINILIQIKGIIIMHKQTVYLAGPFFSDAQIERVRKVEAFLKANATIDADNIFVPMDHSTSQYTFGSVEWKRATFQHDIRQIDNSDVMVLILDYKLEEGNLEPDSGTMMELGYAFAHNTPIIIAQFDANEEPVNLMAAEAYTAFFWKDEVAQLADYDFNALEYKAVERTVI